MTTEIIVPVENTAALEALDPQAREVAITGMLDQARTWLAHAVESTAPAQDIADFKAFIATAAETAKRLKVSKEIQQDAEVMVRRSEDALGRSVRDGQERGEIRIKGEQAAPANQYGSAAPRGLHKSSPSEFFAHHAEQADAYEFASVEPHEFDEALDRAQAEGNVSRANVVRKVREVKSGAERQAEKWERVEALAARGYTSDQIAREVGMTRQGVVLGAARHQIDIRADRIVGRSRRIDTNRVIRETVTALEGLVSGLALIDVADIDDTEEAQTWVDSLSQSISAIRRATNQIKESIS